MIPPISSRRRQRSYDRQLYQARHLIENFFARLKQNRAIATRYDKTAQNFLGAFIRLPLSLSFDSIDETPQCTAE